MPKLDLTEKHLNPGPFVKIDSPADFAYFIRPAQVVPVQQQWNVKKTLR